MLPEHRRMMHEIRRTTERTLTQHRDILRRERTAATQPVREHRRALEAARLQARAYKKEWAEAKRDGARLLQFLERFRPAKPSAA